MTLLWSDAHSFRCQAWPQLGPYLGRFTGTCKKCGFLVSVLDGFGRVSGARDRCERLRLEKRSINQRKLTLETDWAA